MQKIQEKHTLQKNNLRGSGYIDIYQINQEKSYYIASRPTVYGGRYVYQYITMNDGTIYELSSFTATTNGIVAHRCKQKDLLQKEVKRLTKNAIDY